MYVLYVHDAVNSLCARVVARAGGSHARCDDGIFWDLCRIMLAPCENAGSDAAEYSMHSYSILLLYIVQFGSATPVSRLGIASQAFS